MSKVASQRLGLTSDPPGAALRERNPWTTWGLAILLAWTVLVVTAFFWNISHLAHAVAELARMSARATFERDLLYRRWATMHGGVYVPVTEQTPPNPFLSHLRERDITTPSGRALTLINPAYMNRQVYELAARTRGPRTHLTSLKPIRAENGPDPWERRALEAFEQGATEVSEVVLLDGEPTLRLMRPFITEVACLKCHAAQGYREGDVRGGISVELSMVTYAAIERQHEREELLAHSGTWLLGLAFFVVLFWQSQRRRRERQVEAEGQARLGMAVEQTSESIVITDTDARILYVNPAFCRVSGYAAAEVLGQNPRLLKSGKQDAAFYERLWATLLRGETWRGNFTNKRKDGELFEEEAVISPLRDAAGNIVNYVGVKRDVTEERRVQEHLRQAQRMEAVGQLAGGVAHDFNNLLGALTMQINLLQAESPEPTAKKIAQTTAELLTTTQRMATLTRQLLLFSRRQPIAKTRHDLNVLVADMGKLLRRMLAENIDLIVAPHDTPLWVDADSGMIEQVIMNLCVNARDAMPTGGHLTVALDPQVVTFEQLPPGEGSRPGHYGRLRVIDTGIGIDPANLPHIFEPFFTTKEVGKGTGIGLATTHGIVSQHGGWVEVQSEVGRGSTFSVFLPLSEPSARVPTGTTLAHAPARGAGERILVVEDEEDVRRLVMICLAQLGYAATAAVNGEEAVRTWVAEKGRFDLLFTDMVMPGKLSGTDLCRKLRAERADLPAILTTGYSPNLGQTSVGGTGPFALLDKPYDMQRLSTLVRKVLDEAASKRRT